MAGVNSFNRGETLDVFLGMLDESELFHLFKEEMDFFFFFFLSRFSFTNIHESQDCRGRGKAFL